MVIDFFSADFWLILGFLMLILEIFISGVFIMWFGMGAILVAVASYLDITTTIKSQAIFFALISVAIFSLHYFYEKNFKKEKTEEKNTYGEDLINKNGIIEEIDGDLIRGKIAGSIFTLNVINKKNVIVGEHFKVISMEDLILNVEILKD